MARRLNYFKNDMLNANQSELNQPKCRLTAKSTFPTAGNRQNTSTSRGSTGPRVRFDPKVVNTQEQGFWMLRWESMRQRSADP
jgi:hypothetical protein